jgi:hypothetical protein
MKGRFQHTLPKVIDPGRAKHKRMINEAILLISFLLTANLTALEFHIFY